MDDSSSPAQSSFPDLSQFDQVFSRLAPQDIEQFQLVYQHWSLQQEIAATEQQIASVRRQLAENAAWIERVHPSAIALATLARLQASGVEDIDLLDRMLERGEAWLDRTIQQLEYCEQLDVIRGDYEDWCRHALEDAFAWIDSMQSATSADIAAVPAPAPVADPPEPPPAPATELPAGETTEALFLQKLMSEEPGETSESDQEDKSNASNDSEKSEQNADHEDDRIQHQIAVREVHNQPQIQQATVREVQQQPQIQQPAIREAQQQPQIQEETAGRRSNFLQRFLSALWP